MLRRKVLRSLHRPWVLPWGLAGLFAVLYACVALNRHRRILTQAYDLGIFEQAVRAYAQGEAPVVLLKAPGYHLLGDHFHPLLVTLAPLYRAFPAAATLLVAQAVLMALAVVPLARWAHEVGGRRLALVVGCLTGASWGIVEAVADDFHEIAFAVPLLAFAATALGRRRPVAAVLWALPLVLVKEDLGLTVTVVGLLVLLRAPRTRRTRALGLGTAVFGLAATALTVLVVLPSFNPGGTFDYWGQMGGGEAGGPPWAAAVRVVWPPLKWLLLGLAAATAGFLGLRSPLALLCVPTLGWRLIADNPHYWGVGYHYSAVLMPLLVAALVDALDRTGAFARSTAARSAAAARAGVLVGAGVAAGAAAVDGSVAPGGAPPPDGPPAPDGGPAPGGATSPGGAAVPDPTAVRRARRALAVAGLVAVVTLPVYPLHELAAPGAWGTSPRLTATRAMLDRIPDGATVAASNRLAAQLAGRTTVGLVCREPSPPADRERGGPQWVAVDLADPSVKAPCAIADTRRMLDRYELLGYRRVVDDGDLRLLHRP
ncbi:DUF2079 domain-containing protein [Kitasatospora sp. NPDC056327]|uniref:DUF2079 domain-containing protein n=1 Tax=Kitasatospora sp. NPDC056327 TaxID=3345785 RepID=UPI0035DE8162